LKDFNQNRYFIREKYPVFIQKNRLKKSIFLCRNNEFTALKNKDIFIFIRNMSCPADGRAEMFSFYACVFIPVTFKHSCDKKYRRQGFIYSKCRMFYRSKTAPFLLCNLSREPRIQADQRRQTYGFIIAPQPTRLTFS